MEGINMGDKEVTITYTSYQERQEHWARMVALGYRCKSSKTTIEVTYEKVPEVEDEPLNEWSVIDLRRLRELKAILGISNDEGLNEYVREYTGIPTTTYSNITPMNIGDFNKYLEKKC